MAAVRGLALVDKLSMMPILFDMVSFAELVISRQSLDFLTKDVSGSPLVPASADFPVSAYTLRLQLGYGRRRQQMQLGILQQHDRLAIGDFTAAYHLQRLFQRQLQYLDILTFRLQAAAIADA